MYIAIDAATTKALYLHMIFIHIFDIVDYRFQGAEGAAAMVEPLDIDIVFAACSTWDSELYSDTMLVGRVATICGLGTTVEVEGMTAASVHIGMAAVEVVEAFAAGELVMMRTVMSRVILN